MNFRERYILIGVCVLIAVILGYFVQRSVFGMFSSRREAIARLEVEVRDAKKQAMLGKLASVKVAEYQARSLPANSEVARREYPNWLLDEMDKAGLAERKVDFKVQVDGGDLYVKQEFSIQAKGGLPKVVEFLHAFYSQDWTQRLTRLTLRPIKDSKLLTIDMSVETLSLKKAADTQQLVPRPAKRLQLANSKAYYDTIVGRNLFGPANNPPKASISGVKDVYLGRAADLTVKGTDSDVLDKMSYRLVASADPAATLDSATGRFSWKPSSTGKFEFVVEAIDDGYPTKASQPEKFVINVTEQKNSAPVVDDRFKGFDHSKFTILTAVLDIEGQGEIWLHNRPLGEMLKLHSGDKFEIGSMKGTVAEIGQYDFQFDRDGKRLKLAHGDSLFNAKVVGDTPVPATVETSAEATLTPEAPANAAGNGKTAEDAKAGTAKAPPEELLEAGKAG